ncbi:hypothetical protein Gotri_012790 [Gossypium trilobum]|uniref:Uncharacterized protein n=1 Tax=Gossypium trilobum TaxID=34281 RepID=A0A7J9DSJ2_9ROSI|nr:hypothetical protein [Gossypium trilobum]
MSEKVLPHTMLKVRHKLELKIRALENEWAIFYDMLRGKENSDFDRATRKDAQTAVDIIEEIDVEDIAPAKNPEKGSNDHGCKVDVSLDEMDVLATQLHPSKPN